MGFTNSIDIWLRFKAQALVNLIGKVALDPRPTLVRNSSIAYTACILYSCWADKFAWWSIFLTSLCVIFIAIISSGVLRNLNRTLGEEQNWHAYAIYRTFWLWFCPLFVLNLITFAIEPTMKNVTNLTSVIGQIGLGLIYYVGSCKGPPPPVKKTERKLASAF